MVDETHFWSKIKQAKMPKKAIELYDGFAFESADVPDNAYDDG